MQLRVSALGSRERQCCHFARSGTNTLLRRFDRVKKFSPRLLRRSDCDRCWETLCFQIRSAQAIPVRENRKHTELRANHTHGRSGGKPPHAPRSSGFASNSRPRHREGSSAGNVVFCNSVRQSGGSRRRPLPRNARFELSAPAETFARGHKSSCRSPTVLTS